MAHYLPPAIMALFAPRPPIPYKEPITKRKMYPYSGVAGFVQKLKDYDHPPPVKKETPQEKKKKRKVKAKDRHEKRIKIQTEKYNPSHPDNTNMTKDAFKTLYVARLSYDITAEDLKQEFEYYGPIVKCHLVTDKDGKSRGYGFVEFESSRDLKEAYKDADGRKINKRRILVDVERGRTVRDWKPRRLGGGLGGTRKGGKEVNQRFSGREPPQHERRDRGGGGGGGGDRDRDRDRGYDRDRRDSYRGGRDRDRDRDRDRGRGSDRDRDRDRRRRDRSGERDRDRRRRRDDRDGDRERRRRRD
uniref:U1 small nuclear ribonucleoprotein 70 kDa n=1 Tax=Lotharella oceanica TaxID=641309 RepID=A0A7S2TF05_9EUKA|mmetsp:Transcript_11057/g.21178  ORF Transcript_11057/g.21178 Transcript_11057/m.21178 type:complete len:302 (+) Transcript_11057:58-963(+)|eukprot:CAMPEP_0170198746 /NCGR_PEP_ID=MMETSP0040_2-20121228/68956_1 /TAXON_ID=641309 /ORGANISM="Lotharella oceanica, Strain CCMP622" /LENGTH=301 /DNA_ID=CAMNT_0010448793 /DNA_START=58 /DNA_END=966 /DNA_ORIENTATION=+